MKKLLILFILFLSSTAAFAKNVEVECLTPVNSDMETPEFKVKILKEAKFRSGVVFEKNDIVNMDIVEIVPEKKAHRSAYIVVRPISKETEETVCSESSPHECTKEYKTILITDKALEGKSTNMKVVSKLEVKQELKDNWKDDLKKAGKGVTKGVINKTLPGATQIYDVSKGIISPREGQTRLQSAANNLIDDSPLKLLRKGASINIKKGDKLYFKFYHTNVPKWRYFARNK